MNSIVLLFFEITDKVVPTLDLYIVYVVLGLIGLALGLFRWWASAIWLLFPVLLTVSVLGTLQYGEITELYDQMLKELGYSYILHNVAAPALAILLSIAGVIIAVRPRSKDLRFS